MLNSQRNKENQNRIMIIFALYDKSLQKSRILVCSCLQCDSDCEQIMNIYMLIMAITIKFKRSKHVLISSLLVKSCISYSLKPLLVPLFKLMYLGVLLSLNMRGKLRGLSYRLQLYLQNRWSVFQYIFKLI